MAINKHLDKMNMDEIIEKNADKAKKKTEKMKQIREASGLANNAKLSTKAIVNNDDIDSSAKNDGVLDKPAAAKGNYKPGSLAAKANMVRDYNENK